MEDAGRAEVEPHAEDRLCVGWFVDNELPWHTPNLLEAPPESALKGEWVALLQGRHESLAACSQVWQRPFRDWSDTARLTMAEVPPAGPGRADYEALVRHYAEAYFAEIKDVLRRFAPKHLYLGCRFVRNAPAREIVAAAGRHCDVVTVNCYAWEPTREQFGAWHRDCGRPILIGEHHVSLDSPRQLPPLWEAFSPAERERYYANFVETWARQPYSLGCHYFQHADQPATGRGDGENQTVGFVDITDQPHPDLDRALRASLPRVYDWHAASA
jgi:agarase